MGMYGVFFCFVSFLSYSCFCSRRLQKLARRLQKLAKRATMTFPELTLRSAGRSYQKLLSEVVCKAAPERSRKLLFFKESVDQSCSGKLAKAAPQSDSPKLLPKAVPQSISAKRLPQSGMLQTCSPKHLPKIILQSGSRKLLPTVAAESIRKLPPKVAF